MNSCGRCCEHVVTLDKTFSRTRWSEIAGMFYLKTLWTRNFGNEQHNANSQTVKNVGREVDKSRNIAHIKQLGVRISPRRQGEKGICYLQDSFRCDHYATCVATVTRIQTRARRVQRVNLQRKNLRGISADVVTSSIRSCIRCTIAKPNLRNWFLRAINSR